MYSTHIETISETCSSLPVETTTSNAKPPSYAEAIGQLFAESELLPSYEFLYSPKHGIISGLQSAFRAFLITTKEKFTSAVVCLFLIAIFVVCPAVQFIFGVYYQKECLDYDGKTVLASWLLTNSFFLVLLGFLLFIYCNYKCLQMLLFVAGFLFSWLLRGSYLVYGKYIFLVLSAADKGKATLPSYHNCFVATLCVVTITWLVLLFFLVFFTVHTLRASLCKAQTSA